MACALLGNLNDRNLIWQGFLGTGTARVVLTPEEDEEWAQQAVGLFHTALSRYPNDQNLRELIDELINGSEQFWSMWEEGRSTVQRSMSKTIAYPELGTFVLDCDTLLLPDTDQSMIVYSAAAGTDGATALTTLHLTTNHSAGEPGGEPGNGNARRSLR